LPVQHRLEACATFILLEALRLCNGARNSISAVEDRLLLKKRIGDYKVHPCRYSQ